MRVAHHSFAALIQRSEIALGICCIDYVTSIFEEVAKTLFIFFQRFLGSFALGDVLQGGANPNNSPARVLEHLIVKLNLHKRPILTPKGALNIAQWLNSSQFFREGFARNLSIFNELPYMVSDHLF